MPDLLAHVLAAYAVFRLAGLRWKWITRPYVTVGMVGSIVPDVMKVGILVDDSSIENLLGLPFSWFPLHTAGGVLVSCAIGGLLVESGERRRVFGLLVAGAGTHLLLDGLLRKPTGRSDPLLWPLTWYRPPTPGLYLSTEAWPTAAALVFAVAAWLVWRRYSKSDGGGGRGVD